jgi:hypothetical protein
MAYLAVAYPRLEQADRDWLDAYRTRNDARYAPVVAPHFTLVFAVHELTEAQFGAEVAKRLADVEQIIFELNVATLVKDDEGAYFHEFLEPERGRSAIIRLHDRLYSGAFRPFLRLELGYMPHVGIGNDDDGATTKRRFDALNASRLSIKGVIEAVDVIEYRDARVRTRNRIELARTRG